MRRIAFYLGMAAALVASCSIQESNFISPTDRTVFRASFEQPAEEGTRVYANEDFQLRWTADDRVGVFDKNTYNQQHKFDGQTGDSEGGFTKVEGAEFVTGNPIDHIVAVYPYQEAAIDQSEVLTLALPAEQAYAVHSFGPGANTMVSVGTDDALQFKNACGYLRLSLYGEGVTVSTITLTGKKGEKIAGKATVTMPLGGVPTVAMADDATTSITLTCAEPVALGATAAESVDFWFVVPPVTFSEGFTVTVNGDAFEKATTQSVTITRNHLSKMAPVEVSTVVPQSVIYRITHMWLWGGTGPQYGSSSVFDLFTKSDCFNNEDGRGINALKDNYYELCPDGTFINHAGEDGRNWWFVYSGEKNPENGQDLDLRKFYDVLPLAQGQYAIDGSAVTFTRPDNTTTQATFVGPGTYDMPNTSPTKSVTITSMALMFTITGGADLWDGSGAQIMYTDYHKIAGNPRRLYIEMEQMPAGFVVPEASKTTDADFEFKPAFSLTDLIGKWNVYAGNNETKNGLWVIGGSVESGQTFVSPIGKSYNWDDSIWKESDNGLTIKATSMTASEVKGTTNWWSGDDGQFWNYIWKFKKDGMTQYEPYYGTDLSEFYDQIPKGENEYTLNIATMTVSWGNGHQAKVLPPGTHSFYGKTKEVPAGCFALDFHLKDSPGNLPDSQFLYKDIDRFMFSPLEYIIMFEKVE